MCKSFKKLVEMISNCKGTEDDISVCCGEIDLSFDHDKITFAEHEMLYRLVNLISK